MGAPSGGVYEWDALVVNGMTRYEEQIRSRHADRKTFHHHQLFWHASCIVRFSHETYTSPYLTIDIPAGRRARDTDGTSKTPTGRRGTSSGHHRGTIGRRRRSRHPPVESDFLFYGGRYGPVVVRVPRILRGVSEGPWAWGGAAA